MCAAINIVHGYTGDNIVDGDDGRISAPREDRIRLSTRRICDVSVPYVGVWGTFPLGGTGYSTRLKVLGHYEPLWVRVAVAASEGGEHAAT